VKRHENEPRWENQEVQQRLPSLRVPPIGFAHRGARAHAPENTIEGFRLALRLGATGLESDVWLTEDGEAVLDHDGVVRGRFGSRRAIREITRAKLPDHIPTLAELYDACGADFELSLDLKDEAAADAVLSTTRAAHPEAIGRLWLCHPQWQKVAAIRERDGDVRLVDSTRLRALREGAERRAATLADAGIDALNMHHTDWTGGLTTLLHRFGRLAFAWDLQFDDGLRRMLRMGIDGVYSDHVDRMLEALAREVS
jgi:glycerophosphoryl diester phosphodiesterase